MPTDAAEIIRRELGLAATGVIAITGQGECNLVHAVDTRDGSFIVRQAGKKNMLEEYRTEAWCLAQASAAGVPGPEVLAWGGESDDAFMIQRKIEGVVGNDHDGDPVALWREIGRHARAINSIPTQGFGNKMLPGQDGVFKDSWESYIGWWIDKLFESDVLTDTILSPRERDLAQAEIEPMRGWRPASALVHGNLAPKNTIVGPDGVVHIIDYGTGGSFAAPHAELMDVCAWDYPPEYVAAFCDGYGLTARDYNDLKPDITRLALLRALDAVRWAVEDKPDKIDIFANHARQKFDEIMGERTSFAYLAKLQQLRL